MGVYLGPVPGSLIWAICSGEYPRVSPTGGDKQPVYDLLPEPTVLPVASEYLSDSNDYPTYSDCEYEDEDEDEDDYKYEYEDSSEDEPEYEPEYEPDDVYQY